MKKRRNRDYLKERCDYYGNGKASEVTVKQRLRRKHKTSRNLARARIKRLLHRRLGIPGHGISHLDVDHKDGNPLNNRFSNLRLLHVKVNRSRKQIKFFRK